MIESRSIPNSFMGMAFERGIVGIAPYDLRPKADYAYAPLPLLERTDPRRIGQEEELLVTYLSAQDPKEIALFAFLTDGSTIKDDNVDAAGVRKINGKIVYPMDPDCKVAVIIPARFEQDRIKKTLEGYVNQKNVAPSEYELNVIVNHRIGETPDDTSHAVMDFMEEHPQIRVNFIDVQFDQDHAKVGWARKLITDLTLARAVARDEYSHPLYIITEDADINKIDPTIVTRTIIEFEKRPDVDFLRGKERRSTALLSQNALCLIHYMASEIVGILARDTPLRDPKRQKFDFIWNRVISGGWANAFTAEIYSIIGGYTNEPLGEDMRLAHLASIARGYIEDGDFHPDVEIAKTMPVKEESNFLRIGHGLVTNSQPYDTEQFQNQDIKKMEEVEILHALRNWRDIEPNNLNNIKRFTDEIKEYLGYLHDSTGVENFLGKYAERFMFFMGFKPDDWQITESEEGDIKLEIFNWDNLIEKIGKHRKKHQKEFDELYGKGVK